MSYGLNLGWHQTDMQTDRHINTMTRPGLEVGPSENLHGYFPLLNLPHNLWNPSHTYLNNSFPHLLPPPPLLTLCFPNQYYTASQYARHEAGPAWLRQFHLPLEPQQRCTGQQRLKCVQYKICMKCKVYIKVHFAM